VPAADRASRRPPRPTSRRGALAGARALTALLVALAILFASFIKGAIAFGFPLVATPLLALLVDVKTGVAVSILPNIVMDGIQIGRRGAFLSTVRRVALLLAFGLLGTVAGTRSLALMPAGLALAVLGVVVLAFVALNVSRFSIRLPEHWEPWLAPPVGLAAGFLGGVTNVPGTLLVIYFSALGLEKGEFVRSVALCFLTYKVIQLGAVAWYGLLTWPLLGVSAGLTVVGLGAFWGGLRVQDAMPERTFNRVVLVFLTLLGLSLLARAAWLP
jgi:uncharacterized membrane protein YfcA